MRKSFEEFKKVTEEYYKKGTTKQYPGKSCTIYIGCEEAQEVKESGYNDYILAKRPEGWTEEHFFDHSCWCCADNLIELTIPDDRW